MNQNPVSRTRDLRRVMSDVEVTLIIQGSQAENVIFETSALHVVHDFLRRPS